MKSSQLLPAVSFTATLLLGQGCSPQNQWATPYLHPLSREICRDTASGLMWQREESAPITTPDQAKHYIQELRLGGFNDWRLPTRGELHNLISIIDLHLNGECAFDTKRQYWSTEGTGDARVGGWEITANQCDPVREYVPGNSGRIRAVRP